MRRKALVDFASSIILCKYANVCQPFAVMSNKILCVPRTYPSTYNGHIYSYHSQLNNASGVETNNTRRQYGLGQAIEKYDCPQVTSNSTQP
jgi:hypothetical protein